LLVVLGGLVALAVGAGAFYYHMQQDFGEEADEQEPDDPIATRAARDEQQRRDSIKRARLGMARDLGVPERE
jgi:hypothetical protein